MGLSTRKRVKHSLSLLCAVGAILAVALPGYGQDFSDTYTALKQQYPEEQAVYWKYYEDFDITLRADSLLVIS